MDRAVLRAMSAGANQQGVRDHNERLILSLIQRHGALPGADVARLAGLSAQTVSVILRGLEQEGLVVRGEPQRGRVGKPRVPLALAADGVFSVGLKIGRRSADLLLADFHGVVRQQLQSTYRWPEPQALLDFLKVGLARFQAGLRPGQLPRIAGIGIAKPYEIWNWHEALGAPDRALLAWRDLDFEAEVARFSQLPVYVENDATAACRAEHVYGRGREFSDFAYFFVGSFIGGGVVLNHSVFEGRQGNAGAFGSLPAHTPDGREAQLIDTASIFLLESALERAGEDPSRLWLQPQVWDGFGAPLQDWIAVTAAQLARAVQKVCAVVDFEAVLIDGAFPPGVRARVVEETARELATLDLRGLSPVTIGEGSIGSNARALGAACAPVFSRFLLNTHGRLVTG